MNNKLTNNKLQEDGVLNSFNDSNAQVKHLDQCETLEEAIQYMNTIEHKIIENSRTKAVRFVVEGLLDKNYSLESFVKNILKSKYKHPVDYHFLDREDLFEVWYFTYKQTIEPRLFDAVMELVNADIKNNFNPTNAKR